MTMHIDLENAIKAQQCADLLQRDLADLLRSDNPLLADIAIDLMVAVKPVKEKLEQTVCSLDLMKQREQQGTASGAQHEPN